MKETIPESEFQEKLWNAVTIEQFLAIDGLQQIVIRKYNVQLELPYEE